jgi:hypothetical protein
VSGISFKVKLQDPFEFGIFLSLWK